MSQKKQQSDIPLNKKLFSNLESKFLNHKSSNASFDYSVSDSVIDSNPLNPLVNTSIQFANMTPNLNNSYTFENISNQSIDFTNMSIQNNDELLPLDNISFQIQNQINKKSNHSFQSNLPRVSSVDSSWGTITRPFYSNPSDTSLYSHFPKSTSKFNLNNDSNNNFNSLINPAPTPYTNLNSNQNSNQNLSILFPSAFNNFKSTDFSKSTVPPPNIKVNDSNNIPTGEWSNPVVEKALRRMVNKEMEFKRVVYNFTFLIITRFLISIFNNLQNILSQFEIWYKLLIIFNNTEFKYVFDLILKLVQLIFGYNILFGLKKVLQKIDLCADLPLTPKQRLLLGLPVLEEVFEIDNERRDEIPIESTDYNNNDDDEFPKVTAASLPKYHKSKYFKPSTLHRSYSTLTKKPINLKNFNDSIIPNNQQTNSYIGKSILSELDNSDNETEQKLILKRKFSKKFNIDFDSSDSE